MSYQRIILVSPVKEFHIYAADIQLTPKYLKVLVATVRWVSGLLEDHGMDVENVLDIGGIEEGVTPAELMSLFRSRAWERSFNESLSELLRNWADAVALMPECRNVRSELVRNIREMARESFVPVVDVEDLLGISECTLRRDLMAIENAIMEPHQRPKIIMRGSRSL